MAPSFRSPGVSVTTFMACTQVEHKLSRWGTRDARRYSRCECQCAGDMNTHQGIDGTAVLALNTMHAWHNAEFTWWVVTQQKNSTERATQQTKSRPANNEPYACVLPGAQQEHDSQGVLQTLTAAQDGLLLAAVLDLKLCGVFGLGRSSLASTSR